MRYVSTTAYTAPGYITVRSVLNSILCYIDNASYAVPAMSAFKITKVSLASAPSSGLGTDTSEIEMIWLGLRGPEYRLVGRGTSLEPAVIVSSPPAGSYAGMWANSLDVEVLDKILFNFILPQYGLMQIEYDYTLTEGSPSLAVLITDPNISGIFYAALDNATVSVSVYNLYLRPDGMTQSYVTITDPDGLGDARIKREREEVRERMVDDYLQRRKSVRGLLNNQNCDTTQF